MQLDYDREKDRYILTLEPDELGAIARRLTGVQAGSIAVAMADVETIGQLIIFPMKTLRRSVRANNHSQPAHELH